MSLLSCREVSLSYEGRPAVERVTFAVREGDYLCIVGENGSGKSTLVKGLLGLMAPCSGEIRFGDGLTRSAIGYLPQQTQAQRDFPASVGEVVLSGCLARRGALPFYTRDDRERAEAGIRRMGLEKLRKRCYRDLSGGQQQRVLLARALCATQRLLLLDEPVAGLDPVVAGEMYALIGELNKRDHVAVVMVSHDIGMALRHAGKILHLGQEMLFFGPTEEYLRTEACGRLTGGLAG